MTVLANADTTCGLTENRELFCWGWAGDDTFLPRPNPEYQTAAAAIQGRIQSFDMGFGHVCALTMEGDVSCWGRNEYGQLGRGLASAFERVAMRPALPSVRFRALSAGGTHSCAVTYGNELYCWGDNSFGQVGNGTTADAHTPQLISTAAPLPAGSVSSVDVDYQSTCAVTTSSDAVCWGRQFDGVSLYSSTSVVVPTTVTTSTGLASGSVVSIAAQWGGACALTNTGHLYCWGWNGTGSVGDNTTTKRLAPTLVHEGEGLTQGTIVSMATSDSQSCAIESSGELYCWGLYMSLGSLGTSANSNPLEPAKVLTGDGLTDVSAVGVGTIHTCATSGGDFFCWGHNDRGQLGTGDVSERTEPTKINHALPPTTRVLQLVAVSAGDYHTCAVDIENDAYCWGLGADGRLGNDVVFNRSSPSRVSPATGLTPGTVAQVAAGGSHSCARTSAGGVYCWGANWVGQVGDGTTESQALPAPVTGPAGFGAARDIDTGWAHSCMVNTAGAIYCWGGGADGQLGNGTENASSTPVAVSSGGGYTGSNALSVDAGDAHTCAVLSSGDSVCWGANGNGRLGDGTTTSRVVPVAVSSLTSAADLSAGGDHTCALRTNGAVLCWGANTAGQLGQGNTTAALIPTTVTGAGEASSVAAGRQFSCATQTSGATLCWGRNDLAQAGHLGGSNLLTPARVSYGAGLMDDVLHVSAGGKHACAINDSQESLCWGHNSFGQLGNGATNTNGSEPIFVQNTRRGGA